MSRNLDHAVQSPSVNKKTRSGASSWRQHPHTTAKLTPSSLKQLVPPTPQETARLAPFFKTKLCPWYPEGRCRMGSRCNWAHELKELRPSVDLTRTKLCDELLKHGVCRKPWCRFAHSRNDLRATTNVYKTSLCVFWLKGGCAAAETCRYAHGKSDLRLALRTKVTGDPPVPEMVSLESASTKIETSSDVSTTAETTQNDFIEFYTSAVAPSTLTKGFEIVRSGVRAEDYTPGSHSVLSHIQRTRPAKEDTSSDYSLTTFGLNFSDGNNVGPHRMQQSYQTLHTAQPKLSLLAESRERQYEPNQPSRDSTKRFFKDYRGPTAQNNGSSVKTSTIQDGFENISQSNGKYDTASILVNRLLDPPIASNLDDTDEVALNSIEDVFSSSCRSLSSYVFKKQSSVQNAKLLSSLSSALSPSSSTTRGAKDALFCYNRAALSERNQRPNTDTGELLLRLALCNLDDSKEFQHSLASDNRANIPQQRMADRQHSSTDPNQQMEPDSFHLPFTLFSPQQRSYDDTEQITGKKEPPSFSFDASVFCPKKNYPLPTSIRDLEMELPLCFKSGTTGDRRQESVFQWTT